MKRNTGHNPFGPEVVPEAEGSPAIPLWIGGHAFLTMPAAGFYDIRNDAGRVIRRVPLCAADAVDAAMAAALAATTMPWPAADWPAIRASIGALARRYADHLAGLLRSECGAEFDAASELLPLTEGHEGESPAPDRAAPQVHAVIGVASAPLAEPATAALRLLAAGHTVILKPSVKAPSAALAFAEIATRAGLPGGWLNVVHGEEAVIEALCRHPGIAHVECLGRGEATQRVAEIMRSAGRPVT